MNYEAAYNAVSFGLLLRHSFLSLNLLLGTPCSSKSIYVPPNSFILSLVLVINLEEEYRMDKQCAFVSMSLAVANV
jgi:hypothetical protein